MKLRILIALLAVLLPFVAAGCGNKSTGDLSKNDIVKQLEKAGVPDAQAPCVANALKKANFNKDELNNLSKDKNFLSTGKGKEYLDAVTKCVTGGSSITTPGG